MPVIYFAGKQYALDEGENLLSGLLRQQVRIPFSCRAGVCHSCLLKLDKGTLPLESQLTLSADQREKQCFLACQSLVNSDLSISMPSRNFIPARVINLTKLSATELQLTLSTRFPLDVQVGHSIKLSTQAGVESQHTVHAVNCTQDTIELIVFRKAGDEFSRWLHESCQTGDSFILKQLSEGD